MTNIKPMAETPRNRTLDGLRGAAVLLVLLYHHSLLNSGWLGVDLFFVLSGYLITTILRRGRDSEEYWRSFWIKRAFRIVPPLLLVLLLVKALAFPLTASQAALYLASMGDAMAWLRPTFEPLRPLWSLAVEEHFYLLWPFAVRLCRRGTLLRMLVALLALEPMLRGVASLYTHDWQAVYFLTPFRLDGLAWGALLALLLEDARTAEPLVRASLPAGVGAAAVYTCLRAALGTAFTRDNPTPAYNALAYSLVALMCVCAIARVLQRPAGVTARLLAWRPLAALGTVSYGLYLYQMPVHEALSRCLPGTGRVALLALDAPLTLALAAASFHWVEKPLIRLGRRFAVRPPAIRHKAHTHSASLAH